MIQDVRLVGDRDARKQQLFDGTDDVSRFHVFAPDSVFADEQDTRVRLPTCLPLLGFPRFILLNQLQVCNQASEVWSWF